MKKSLCRRWTAVILTLVLCVGMMPPAYAGSGQVTFCGIDTLMIYNPAAAEKQTMSTGTMEVYVETADAGISSVGAAGKRSGYFYDYGAQLRSEWMHSRTVGQQASPVAWETAAEGDQKTFFYQPGYLYLKESAEFTCLYAGEHCMIWGFDYSDGSEATAIGAEFDGKIYENNSLYFGSARFMENGVPLNILIYPMSDKQKAGFFRPEELLTAEERGAAAAGYNCGMPIIHLNSAAEAVLAGGETLTFSDVACATIAHEFQHLIAMSSALAGSGTEMGLWLDEAMSKQAEELNCPGEIARWGYITGHYNQSRLIKSGQSLYDFTTWYDDIGVYGQGFIFSEYLKQQYGSAGVFAAMHDYWRNAGSDIASDAHMLYHVLPESVRTALMNQVNYPASVRSAFEGEEEELLSKLNLAFQMAVFLKQDSGIYSMPESCSKAVPDLFSDMQCAIEGGGRILVKTVDGNSYTVPADADSRLIYVGFKEGELVFGPVTADAYASSRYEIRAVSCDDALGQVSVSDGIIAAVPASGCGYAVPACTVLSGTARVERKGDLFMVYPSSDCTVQINFERKNQLSDIWDGSVAETIPVSGNIYTIATCSQLAKLAQLVNGGESFAGKTVMLTADLNLNGRPWTPIGNAEDRPFSGVFEGSGHTVSDLSIGSMEVPVSGKGAGLFGFVSGSSSGIRNLTVENAAVFGADCVAGLAGNLSSGEIIACRVSGTASGSSDVGLLGGSAVNSRITCCGAEGAVVCSGSNGGGLMGRLEGDCTVSQSQTVVSVSGGENVGGLVGRIDGNGTLCITDSFSRSELTGSSGVGGIAGRISKAEISACYWTGTLASDGVQGGIAGAYSGTVDFYGCRYDRSGCEAAVAGGSRTGIAALSVSEMKDPDSYYGWDFSALWGSSYRVNDGFPYLRWQTFGGTAEFTVSLSQMTETETSATVKLMLCAPEETQTVLVLAAYRGGQLENCALLTLFLSRGINEVSAELNVTLEEPLMYRAFLMTGDGYEPLADCLQFSSET